MTALISIRPVEMADANDIQHHASDVRLHATCNLPSPYPAGGATAFLAAALQARQAETQITLRLDATMIV